MRGSYRELLTYLALTWLRWVSVIKANSVTGHSYSSISVSAPYLSYACPAGATVRLLCTKTGAKMHAADELRYPWRFTPHLDQDCHDKVHPRGNRHHGNHSSHALPPGVRYQGNGDFFWVELQNVTAEDQGRYCCQTLEVQHGKLVQRPHAHVLLTVTPRRAGSPNCTHWSPQAPEGTVTAGLATAACIMAILSLPLILILVYRQKHNSHASRRAHELVRMDSQAQGHENPVFLGGSPQAKTRTVSQIMTRQSSETGRHLLADPGTPFSPTLGEVFFPSNEPIPESPDFMQV